MRSFKSYVTVVSFLHLVTKLIELEGRVLGSVLTLLNGKNHKPGDQIKFLEIMI